MNLFIKSLILSSIFLVSCSGEKQTETEDIHDHDYFDVNENQKALAGIVIGRPEMRVIGRRLSCSGMVDVPPESRANISAPLGGFVRKAPHYEGAKVKKGEVLIGLVHPDYIRLQQDYLEAKSQLDFLEIDLDRQKTLQEGEAASTKRVQEIKSSYRVIQARVKGLEAQLHLIGIDINELEDLKISEMIYLRAPFTGIISMEAVSLGKQVGPEEVLYQMYDPQHMHIELQVFPRDLELIKEGQKIRFKVQGGTNWHQGHIVQIGGAVHPEMRTIRVHAHPDDESIPLRPGTFVTAEIEVESVEVLSLPETAFQIEEGKYFVFITEGTGFRRIPLRVGKHADGFVELKQAIEDDVIVEGAYYLVEVDEDDHDH
ncbi:MAG: efflux RND transporter periplasmic adaptor subunit [Cryomorphaceae bacterium]|nr:efflux RND transporter periplasmic adaptor subunit [Cryomorphaceae bacterium]